MRATASGCSLKNELDDRRSQNTGEYEKIVSALFYMQSYVKSRDGLIIDHTFRLNHMKGIGTTLSENSNCDLLQLNKKILLLESMFQEATNCRNVFHRALTG